MIILEDLEDLIIDEIVKSNPVVMVGSLISSFTPTSIPAGGEILKQMYDYIFPEYKTNNKLRKEFNNMPFEALYSCAPEGVVKPENLAKMFIGKTSNNLHEILANKFNTGEISSIITPNYDNCIDYFIQDKSRILYSNNCCEIANNKKLNNVLFKIHGSIDNPSTMIYTIEQEKKLDTQKTETLKLILKDKILIVIGYSGRDFDICPLITSQEVYQYKKIIWLQYRNEKGDKEELSAYAKLVIKEEEGNNLVIGGDLQNLIKRFWSKYYINIDYSPEKFNPSIYFPLTKEEKCMWQMKVLNRLSCGILGYNHLNKNIDKIDETFYMEMIWDVFGHKQETKKALTVLKELLKKYYSKNRESKKYFITLSNLAGMSLQNGCFIMAWHYNRKAKKYANKHYKNNNEINSNLLHRNLTRYISLSKMNIPFAKKKAISILEQLIKKDIFLDLTWDQKQGLYHAKDRLNADNI